AHPVRGRFRPGGGRVLFRRGGAGAGSWRGVPVVAGLGGRAALPAAGPGRGGAGGLAAAAVVAAHVLRPAFDGADRGAARRGRPAARGWAAGDHPGRGGGGGGAGGHAPGVGGAGGDGLAALRAGLFGARLLTATLCAAPTSAVRSASAQRSDPPRAGGWIGGGSSRVC